MTDLRDFLAKAKDLGECRTVEGANWDLEIGSITDLSFLSSPNPPALVFDDIPGFRKGYRVVSNLFATPRRVALALGLPLEAKGLELVKLYRDKLAKRTELIPPVEVEDAVVKENVHIKDEVNLLEFPTPRWHELDGGRYIGTGSMTITRDPDEGWINLGTYRVQVHDSTTATIYMSPGRHGDIMRTKYWAKGLACPAAVTCGQEPLLFAVSDIAIPWGISEYDFAGGLRGEPIKTTKGLVTGLPIPATAEIVLEGEIVPPERETRLEGPFGEWTGYYGSAARTEAAFKVKAVLHRNDPIIMGAPPTRFASQSSVGRNYRRAAGLWLELDRHVPGVRGVWVVEDAAGPHMVVISLAQKYAGHAKEAAMQAIAYPGTGYMSRFIIVVDDDIDPSNLSGVLWALGTRVDPDDSIDIVRHIWGSPLDPRLDPEKRRRAQFEHSAAIILACKPYHWMSDFPRDIRVSDELAARVKERWPGVVN